MHRLALRSLVLAATALLLTTAACDSGAPKADAGKKADGGAADAAKADDGKADDGKAVEAADASAGDETTGGAEETGGAEDTGGGETGEAVPAAGEEGGDKPDDGGDKPATDDKPDDKPPADKPATDDKVAKIDGKPLFEKKCKSCHGIDGKGDTTIGKKVDIPSLVKTKLSKAKIVANITNGVPDTKMKAYKDKLSKDEIDAIATYVKKL